MTKILAFLALALAVNGTELSAARIYPPQVEWYEASDGETVLTSHPGAILRSKFIPYNGETIRMMDDSVWAVAPGDREKVRGWFGEDLVLMPNHNYLSRYGYEIFNFSTLDRVQVNMREGPFYQGMYSYWVVHVNDAANQIYLSDGSIWKVLSLDAAKIRAWKINQHVIIGVYQGAYSGVYPNILMNVEKDANGAWEYVVCKCVCR